jgi:arginine decarboxylase
MVNIGSTRGSATYLLDVLLKIAEELEQRDEEQSDLDRALARGRVHSLIEKLPPLPSFSHFHRAFVPDPTGGTPEGDMRAAFFLAYDYAACEYVSMEATAELLAQGREVVSAAFVTPYPPGFPVLVPGQVLTGDILDYLSALDVKEIHGYEALHGFRVFRAEALAARGSDTDSVHRNPKEDPR